MSALFASISVRLNDRPDRERAPQRWCKTPARSTEPW